MKPESKHAGRMLTFVLPLLLLHAVGLAAQGVTTAGLHGVVRGPDSTGIGAVIVEITNIANGERWRTTTNARGGYNLEYLSLGGPYTIVARAVGYQPATRTDVTLSLGERRREDFMLASVVYELTALTVTVDRLLNAGRTGPSQTISARQAEGLPISGRDFSQLTFLSPQAVITGDLGTSFAGQSDRLNGLQIDGANNVDFGGVDGLYKFGTAGSLNGARALSIEAVRELQVLVAPFDVRYGMFAGGLVNAVTRSGSNRWEGSVSSYYQTEALTGKDATGNRAEEFSNRELTVTLAGPIVKNRAAFFLDASVQGVVGARGQTIGSDTTGGADSVGIGIRRSSAERFQTILRNRYGVEAGAIGAVADRIPAWNTFGKITLWPALNQRVEISYNHASGTPKYGAYFNGLIYYLSSVGSSNPGTVDATRLAWTKTSGRVTNEFQLALLATTDRCETGTDFSEVRASVGPRVLAAGRPWRCDGVYTNNSSWELTDNLSRFVGAHHLMIGVHGELIHQAGMRRLFQPHGLWNFSSLDSLAAGLPVRYRRDVDDISHPEGRPSDFRVRQIGFYLQDQWLPAANLTITAGVRVDAPFLPDAVPTHQMLRDSLGINSSLTPSGNLLWSPRLGLNYDVGGHGKNFVRGGAGLFAGRPIYLFFSDVYETAARETRSLDCRGANVPAFTLDLANQPRTCGSGSGASLEPVPSYFDPSFKFPRNLRLSLGADVSMPWNLVGTVDLLYIKGVDQLDVIDANLAGPTGTAAGEGGRVMYGSIDEDGVSTPKRLSNGFGRVPEMRNGSGDRSISATVQLLKRLSGGTELSLAYTRTDAHDRMSAVCYSLSCNLDWTPVDGTLNDRRLATARFEAAHKITFSGVVQLPAQFRLGVFYNGYTGIPYTYIVGGDPNADGLNNFGGNDAIYVPLNAADITLNDPTQWVELDRFINASPCLRSQRGQVMRRNSCRDHWLTLLNARVSKRFPVRGGQSIELITDVFNLLNMIDRDWGVQRRMEGYGGDGSLLVLVGYDEAKQRGIYEVNRIDPNGRDNEATRWRLQLGARYTF